MTGAIEKAANLVNSDHEMLKRMARVTALIDGFEDPYGLELLSSVHWVMCREEKSRNSADEAVVAVHQWNPRKKSTLKPEHLRKAWHRLKELHWDRESLSAMH